jgi:putative transcriptional regulator
LARRPTRIKVTGVNPDAPTPDQAIDLHGQLLLADPSLRDGLFCRSVVLLAEHSTTDGAFGLVLNQPTGHLVGDFLTDELFLPLRKVPVHQGGPVAQEQLTFSAFWWNHEKNSLRWSIRISAEDAIAHSQRPGTLIRAFLGYSGWSPGQLENELRSHSWITSKPELSLLGKTHDKALWADVLRALSPFHRLLAEAPEDPFMN